MERLYKVSAREDYPYCISCDDKMNLLSYQGSSIVYACVCGEVVEVKLYERS